MVAHAPTQRLNAHHSADVLALARAFGGHPDAALARAVGVDRSGIRLAIYYSPSGHHVARVEFAAAVPDLAPDMPMRRAFRAAARSARQLLSA